MQQHLIKLKLKIKNTLIDVYLFLISILLDVFALTKIRLQKKLIFKN